MVIQDDTATIIIPVMISTRFMTELGMEFDQQQDEHHDPDVQ